MVIHSKIKEKEEEGVNVMQGQKTKGHNNVD
jgi:hypothetical protein